MSKLDTFLNVDQSLSLRGLGKLSKAQLIVALNNNEQLVKLKSQLGGEMTSMNNLLAHQNAAQSEMLHLQKQQLKNQQQFLENQIKEIESRQLQKFHRERIVRCKEIVDDFKDSKDPYIQKVFLKDFIGPAEILIDESRSELDEITDKEFCLNLKKEIRHILSTGTSDDIDLNELNQLLENKSKLLEFQDKIDAAKELASDSKTFIDEVKRSKMVKESVIKTKRSMPTTVKVSIVLIVLLIIGMFSDDPDNPMPSGGYVVLAVCVFLVLRYYFQGIKEKDKNIASAIKQKEVHEKLLKTAEEDKLNSEIDLKALVKEESKLLSSFHQLYSDVIYKHPEFLKFDYLLDLYKV